MKGFKVLAFVLALFMLAGMAACGGSANQTTTAAATQAAQTTQAATEKTKEPVTLRVLTTDVVDFNNYPDNPVNKELIKQTGITVQFEYADKDRFNVILAGGDLPDIVRAMNNTDDNHQKKLMDAQQIIALDDLLKTNGQDIVSIEPKMLEFSKKYRSQGQDKTYFLFQGVGKESYGIDQTIGMIVRWDYYKELGYPEIKNMDDYLTVLKQMVDKHPTTPEGKKIYGIGLWNDMGSWCYAMITSFLNGYINYGTYEDQKTVLPLYTLPDGPHWSAVKWLYKANQMGLLDPDALIMTYNDAAAKATAGQLLYAPASWPFNDYNAAHGAEGKGYTALALDWGGIWSGADYYAGWDDKGFCITKNCKTPDRAMDLLNYMWSYDGARLAYSGVQGEQWDMIDGKPAVKPEILQLKAAGGDEWKKLQIAQNNPGLGSLVGLNPFNINPKDNQPVSLFDSEDVYAANLNAMQKDYADHFGVKYPSQAFAKKFEEGKMKDNSLVNMYVSGAMEQAPSDISAINSKVDQAFIKAAAKAVLAKSEADFGKIYNDFVKEANDLGYQTYIEWVQKAHDAALAKLGLN